MPDHVHLLLMAGDKSPATRLGGHEVPSETLVAAQSRVGGDLSPPTANVSQIMHAIKGRSARQINKILGTSGQLWQHDFYEHSIRNEADFEEKLNYIHANPIRARFVNDPVNFKYSSYRNYFMNDQSVIAIDGLGESWR
ncbi:MAG: transposase [Parcubacteria group bacterium]